MLITKDKSFYRELLGLTVPIALSSLIAFSISLSGNIFSARLGEEAAGAVFIAGQIQMALNLLNVGIEGAILVLTARSDGGSRHEAAKKYASIGLLSSLAVSLAFSLICLLIPERVLSLLTDKNELSELAVPYLRIISLSFIPFCLSGSLASALRAVKKPKIPFYSSLSALVITLALDYLLIFGKFGFPRLGIIGAAIASLAGRLAEFIFTAAYTFLIEHDLSLKIKRLLCFKLCDVVDFFTLGGPIILAQAVWCVNNLFFSATIGKLNAVGAVAAAAAAVALYNLSYVVTNGMSGAVGIITARIIGEGKYDKLREYSRTVEIIFVLLGVITGIFICLIRDPFISLWKLSGEAQRLAKSFMGILSVFVVGTAYQSASLSGIIKSRGETSFILKLEAFSVFVLIIPLTQLLISLGATPCLIFAALKCDQIIKCPIAFCKLRRQSDSN